MLDITKGDKKCNEIRSGNSKVKRLEWEWVGHLAKKMDQRIANKISEGMQKGEKKATRKMGKRN